MNRNASIQFLTDRALKVNLIGTCLNASEILTDNKNAIGK